MEIVRISSKSRSNAAAGAIAGIVRDHGVANVQAIGAGAVNQAVKAVAIARRYLRVDSIDAVCYPVFVELLINGEQRTGLRITVEPR